MGHRLSKIYTKTGDDGTTGLGDGSRVDKDCPRVEAYGAVDEANSAIGVVLGFAAVSDDIRRCLTEVQHDLFELGGELCHTRASGGAGRVHHQTGAGPRRFQRRFAVTQGIYFAGRRPGGGGLPSCQEPS